MGHSHSHTATPKRHGPVDSASPDAFDISHNGRWVIRRSRPTTFCVSITTISTVSIVPIVRDDAVKIRLWIVDREMPLESPPMTPAQAHAFMERLMEAQ